MCLCVCVVTLVQFKFYAYHIEQVEIFATLLTPPRYKAVARYEGK